MVSSRALCAHGAPAVQLAQHCTVGVVVDNPVAHVQSAKRAEVQSAWDRLAHGDSECCDDGVAFVSRKQADAHMQERGKVFAPRDRPWALLDECDAVGEIHSQTLTQGNP
jgi:hypothetical protein